MTLTEIENRANTPVQGTSDQCYIAAYQLHIDTTLLLRLIREELVPRMAWPKLELFSDRSDSVAIERRSMAEVDRLLSEYAEK